MGHAGPPPAHAHDFGLVGIDAMSHPGPAGAPADVLEMFDGAAAPGGSITWSSRLDSIATLRGRVGFAWTPNTMVYLTGGGAWGRTSFSSTGSRPTLISISKSAPSCCVK